MKLIFFYLIVYRLLRRQPSGSVSRILGSFNGVKWPAARKIKLFTMGKTPRGVDIEPGEKQKNSSIAHDWIGFQYILEDARLPWCYDIYSNCIHAICWMLTSRSRKRDHHQGDKARIQFLWNLSIHGICHLLLILWPHTGEYRPMNRIGGISESISPLSKMSFETAMHGEVHNLEAWGGRYHLQVKYLMLGRVLDCLWKWYWIFWSDA